jgi:hypothetical protein
MSEPMSVYDRLMATDEIDLTSLCPIRKIVTIKGQKLLLCEADGEAVRMYKNLSMRAAKYGADGKVESIEGLADVETQLVGDCLFTMTTQGEPDKKVGLVFAKKLNNRILKPLFEFVKKVSEIEDDQETVEFLEKRIQSDTEKIKKLKKDNPLKNGQTTTPDSLSSVDSLSGR